MPEALSPQQQIARAEALEALQRTDGWEVVLTYLDEQVRMAMSKLRHVDPNDACAIAALQVKAHQCEAIPAWIDEQIRRGQQAREQIARRNDHAARSR